MKKIVIALLISIIVITGLTFGAAWFMYGRNPDVFLPYTRINGIYVAGLTASEAEEKLSQSVKDRNFRFIYEDRSYSVSMKSLNFDHSAEPALESRTIIDPVRSLFRIRKDYKIPMNPVSSDEFLDDIKALPFCDNKGKEKTRDAYVDLSDTSFRVVKEQIGTEVDPERVRDIAFAKISDCQYTAKLTQDDIVRLPEITENSKELKERLEYCRDNLSFEIEVVTDGYPTMLTPEDIDKMADYSGDKPKLKKKKIEKFATKYASGYNEYNEDYRFITHSGRNISVKGVNYGKVLDKAALISDLKKALKKQKSKQIETSWAQTTYSGGTNIGNSYIEISIDAQHVWCYKNGNLVVDCDCVTGAPGHDTSKGLFIIQYVTGPTTLRGYNGDGTKYESPVNCFMPFYGGQGLHGSGGWRSKWGGSIYKTNGSHGCVNCPDKAAKKMADTVGYGYPVVIY